MGDRERVEYERGLRSAVLRGDESAWRTWYVACDGDLRRYVHWRAGRRSDWAEDLLQDAWMTAVKQVRTFDPAAGTFRNWVLGIAANLLRNRFRKAVLPVAAVPVGEVPGRSAGEDDTPERTAHALAQLNPRHERVLRAKYFDEKSVADIAVEWNEPPKAIESLLTRAREAFRAAYGPGKATNA